MTEDDEGKDEDDNDDDEIEIRPPAPQKPGELPDGGNPTNTAKTVPLGGFLKLRYTCTLLHLRFV